MNNHNCSDVYVANLKVCYVMHSMYHVGCDFTLSHEVNSVKHHQK